MAGLAGVETKREDGGRRQRRDKEGEKKRKGKENVKFTSPTQQPHNNPFT
jgi:hypothetical protein